MKKAIITGGSFYHQNLFKVCGGGLEICLLQGFIYPIFIRRSYAILIMWFWLLGLMGSF
ncbi:hypothetical protein [Helicobacter apodemus]|uniref:hypothetical protein n=1 Tax=Helicobacter apodemus TaxID=135569 RepID=UPI0013A56445|nr:hypothetical protein [Helicobacter apodemus]